MLTRFASDRRGTTAVTFGMVALTIVMAISASIDYNRSVSARNAGQAAIDVAVLAAATETAGNFKDVGEKTIKLALANGYEIKSFSFERPSPDHTTATAILELPTTFSGRSA